MARNPEYLAINEPIKITYGKEIYYIKDKIKAPIKALTNGGARISIFDNYDGDEAIVLVIDRKMKRK